MSEFKQSLKSSSGRLAAGVLGQVINSLGQIAVVPLFLHYWTKREYGEWLMLTAIPSLLWSVEGGLGWLAINQMVLNSVVGDWKVANRWLHSIFVVQSFISMSMLGGGILFAFTVNFLPLFAIQGMALPEGQYVLVTMLAYMLFGWGIALVRAPYFASELSARGTMLTNCWKFSDLVVVCLVLTFGGHAWQLATTEMLVAASWMALGFLDMRHRCPQVEFHLHDVTWKSCRAVFRDGTPLFLTQAADAFYIQGYPLIIGWTLGTLWVVNFTAIRTVTRVLLQLILILTRAASIELASSMARQQWELYVRWVKIMLACILCGGVVACLMLTFVGPDFVRIWTHGKVTVSSQLLLLFGISVTLQAGWSLFGAMLYSANKHHLQCYSYFIITIAALATGWATFRPMGFGFIPVLMIIADALILIISIVLSIRHLREVNFWSLMRLFYPLFYWNKLIWAASAVRNRSSLRIGLER